MGLSNDLISQFVKMTNDKSPTKGETTVYGTAVDNNGKIFVKIDGSDIVTPVNTITDVKSGERVIVTIKNHSATITGNTSSPSARTDDVKEVKEEVSNVKVLVADKASIGDLEAESARIDNLVADNVTIKDNLTASNADIDSLKASNVEITEKLTANEADISKLKTDKLDASAADIKYATIENLEATNAEIHNLDVTYGEFKDLTTDKLTAIDASIDNLETNKLSATDADIKYANIDFANIGEAAIENFYAKSGVIQDVVISDGQVTGTLVGVTIKGDLIEGGTVVADKLVIKGEDGLYYKLNTNGETVSSEQTEYNSLSGTIITAKSVTAEKIAVDDLVAFDATIGGFNITDKAIYSGVKNSVDNTTRGIYQDSDGQMALGDASNFLKYYKDTSGNYKLEISADSISFGSEKKSIETAITQAIDDVEVGGRNFIINSSEEKSQTRETTNTFIDYDFSSSLLECDSESFVVSYDAKCETESDNMTCAFYFRDDSASIVNYTSKTLTANYTRYSDILTFKEGYSISNIVYTRFAINSGTGTVYVKNVKLESGNKVTDWTPAPEDITSEIAAVNDTIHSQRTEIIEDCESIVLSAIETRVSSDEYAELRETVESQFTILSDEINMKFSENSEAINTVNGELNKQITNLYKHISFSENGIIIQSGENSVELQLDNDKGIIFSKNGQEFGSWDGTDFHTGNIVIEVNEKAQFGNFAFIPRTDGSMSFLKVKDRLLQIYQQPQDYTGAVGETAVFNITAYGENVTYQWQYRNANASSWTKSSMTGNTTATLSVPIAEKRNGQQYRCIVSDAAGNQIISNSAVLHVLTEEGS